MHQDIERVLISEQELAARIAELGKQVAADYAALSGIMALFLR